MSEQKFIMLQICIICFLVFMLGAVVLLQHTEWFNGEGHDYRAVTLRHRSDDSATDSATNIETTTEAAATAGVLRRQPQLIKPACRVARCQRDSAAAFFKP
jgi:hypothetical protein